MTVSPPSLQRRHLLAGSAAAFTAAGLGGLPGAAQAQMAPPAAPPAAKPLPAFAAWKDANALIVHSSSTVETKRSAFGSSVITPAEQLYIRNNLPPPDAAILADRDAWTLSVEGVKSPRPLSERAGCASAG